MRRLLLAFVLVGALAGCSSGSSDQASSEKTVSSGAASSTPPKAASTTSSKGAATTSPKGAATTSPKAASGSSKVAVGKATTFCAAFKEMQSVKASDGAAAAGAAYQTIAAEMRKYSPAAINDAAEAYADVIENSGKALKTGTMPTAAGVSSKDLAKVTVWVTKNCKS
jgi:uncharacterized protein YceK